MNSRSEPYLTRRYMYVNFEFVHCRPLSCRVICQLGTLRIQHSMNTFEQTRTDVDIIIVMYSTGKSLITFD